MLNFHNSAIKTWLWFIMILGEFTNWTVISQIEQHKKLKQKNKKMSDHPPVTCIIKANIWLCYQVQKVATSIYQSMVQLNNNSMQHISTKRKVFYSTKIRGYFLISFKHDIFISTKMKKSVYNYDIHDWLPALFIIIWWHWYHGITKTIHFNSNTNHINNRCVNKSFM